MTKPKKPSKTKQAEQFVQRYLARFPSDSAAASRVVRLATIKTGISTAYLKRSAAKWSWLDITDGVWRLKEQG